MKMKSYFSATVEGAMAQARQELGGEAMLVDSRPAPAEARHLGDYEVVFATDVAPGPSVPSRSGETFNQRLSVEIAEMKRELESMRSALRRSVYAPPVRHGVSHRFADAYAGLAAAEVSPDLAREIVEAAEARLQTARPAPGHLPLRVQAPPADGAFEQALVQEIEARVHCEPGLGRGEAAPHIAALVGPPGAGKTTTLVKLAVNYGLVSRRPILLLSLDTYRVAAADQLRSYAAILGVGFQIVETVSALAQTIEENRGKELILIDTPGLGAAEMDDAMGLARFLSSRTDIDTQLVLSASMRASDLARTVDAFGQFHPQRLLFTKLDETGTYGPILNEGVRTGKHLSFFTSGQRIPEDLEAATSARLIGLLLPAIPAAQRPAVCA
jgi:flagellar biosynthesis protein FlhF